VADAAGLLSFHFILYYIKRCDIDVLYLALCPCCPADTLELYYMNNGSKTPVSLVKNGIAWWTDKHVKFRNPGGNSNLTAAFQGLRTFYSFRKETYLFFRFRFRFFLFSPFFLLFCSAAEPCAAMQRNFVNAMGGTTGSKTVKIS